MGMMEPRSTKRSSTPPAELGHRWYFAEWAAFFGYRQADAERELSWPRAKVSDLWNGKQRYTQETVDQVSRWLGVAPFELLLTPAEALSFRSIRETAKQIASQPELPMAAEKGRAFDRSPPISRPKRAIARTN